MSLIVNRVLTRLHKYNQNWVAIIIGKTGTGKSYAAMRLGEMIDPNFTADNIVFTPEDFTELLKNGNLKQGSCIIFDEAGVGMPAREWHSIQNKLLGYILQTFRHRNLAVIFTTPSVDFVDIQARKLFHAQIETRAIHYKKNICIAKYKIPEYNIHTNRWFYKFPRNSSGPVKTIHISKPSQRLIAIYEEKKFEYTATLLKTSDDNIVMMREKLDPTPTHRCKECDYEWKSRAIKPRCSRCWSINVMMIRPVAPSYSSKKKIKETSMGVPA